MLSVASLLNPINPDPRGSRHTSSSLSPPYTTVFAHDSSNLSMQSSSSSIKKQKMTKDGAVFSKSKIKGEINYPPFEQFDTDTLQEIQKFQVYPLGKITDYARHIPYNSEKKNFLEKTGRESFEVFQYIFKVPGNDKDYTVMWDYNIGLVRITPFFKSLGHTKTTPAKMLNQNPGLKEITHSITGGALAAQGYWMPYTCALAVCTTFCHDIAGALIPIFGPNFPSLCVPPEAPEFNRWTIDPSLITAATVQADNYRLACSSTPDMSTASTASPSPSIGHAMMMQRNRLPPQTRSSTIDFRRLRIGNKRAYGGEDTDTDASEASSDAYFCSPGIPPSSSWSSQNHASLTANSSVGLRIDTDFGTRGRGMEPKLPNPWLSAIPRSTGIPVDVKHWRVPKRRVEEEERIAVTADEEYDGEGSVSVDLGDEKGSERSDISMEDGGTEKKAAWLLMNLSVRDIELCEGSPKERNELVEEGPRVKRRRATSM